MRAVTYRTYGSPDVLQLEEVPAPAPKDNEVLIRVDAAVVTAADCAFRRGEPFIARLAVGLMRPRTTILGSEFTGEIEAVGKDVRRFSKGDRVYAASGVKGGAYAEYLCLPEEGAVAVRPPGLSAAEAAAVCEGLLTALPFLRDKAKLRSGQTVLINALSPRPVAVP
jgi:NADPH:quinone reductase-like Zn-dependent oxidoreductase